MTWRLTAACIPAGFLSPTAGAGGSPDWWNPQWRFRTTVERPKPYRDKAVRPVEVVVHLARFLDEAGLPGTVDPNSLRVVQHDAQGTRHEVPCAWHPEFNAELGIEQGSLTWLARRQAGHDGAAEIDFDVKQRGLRPAGYDKDVLPPEDRLANPSLEEVAGETPADYSFRHS